MRYLIRAILIGSVLATLTATPVFAADPERVYNRVANSDDPEATYRALTDEQKDAFKKYVRPDSISRNSNLMASYYDDDCTVAGHVFEARNFLGVALWSWNMYAEWCYDTTRTRLTYSYVRSYGRTHVLFWSWTRLDLEKAVNSTANPDRFTAFSQAEFKMCLFGDIGCTTYRYPWIELKVWGLGHAYHAWRAGS